MLGEERIRQSEGGFRPRDLALESLSGELGWLAALSGFKGVEGKVCFN